MLLFIYSLSQSCPPFFRSIESAHSVVNGQGGVSCVEAARIRVAVYPSMLLDEFGTIDEDHCAFDPLCQGDSVVVQSQCVAR